MKFLSIGVCILCLCLLVACGSGDDKNQKVALAAQAKILVSLRPDFTWAGFQRFWHRGADAKVDITAAKRYGGGYIYDYGYGVTIQVVAEDDLMAGSVLQYAALEGNNDGGLQFIRVMRHMMRIGTYRWEMKDRELLYKYFEVMSPSMKEFYYKNSYFIRMYDATSKIWTFKFFFTQENSVMRTEPALSEAP